MDDGLPKWPSLGGDLLFGELCHFTSLETNDGSPHVDWCSLPGLLKLLFDIGIRQGDASGRSTFLRAAHLTLWLVLLIMIQVWLAKCLLLGVGGADPAGSIYKSLFTSGETVSDGYRLPGSFLCLGWRWGVTCVTESLHVIGFLLVAHNWSARLRLVGGWCFGAWHSISGVNLILN